MTIMLSLISIIEVLLITIPVLLIVAFVTVAERKTMASMQRRLGPNAVGYYGLLQAFADALKLLLKEYVSPTQSNIILFFIGPVLTLIFSLLGYAVIPYGPGLAIYDMDLGILYMLAVSSLSTYGILLAGWSANSKYAFLGSKWPTRNVSFYMQRTICEKLTRTLFLNLLGTLYVTLKFSIKMLGFKVKILLSVNNPQVTKVFNSLVGTSEAIRSLSMLYINSFTYIFNLLINKKKLNKVCIRSYIKINNPENPGNSDIKWCQWLAGLIDGDGSFYLTKKGYVSLEITMDIRDEHALQQVKNVYGGSIKLVSGKKALRYSLRHKSGILSIIRDVNGEIRNSYRLTQLNKICLKYDIVLVYPKKMQHNNGWLSGFFDADGTITLNKNNGQLAIALTQKTGELLQPFTDLYGGSIYIDRTTNSYKWYITNKDGILKLVDYFKQFPPRSLKKNRILLIKKCYELKDMKAHKSPNNFLTKTWNIFIDNWDKNENLT